MIPAHERFVGSMPARVTPTPFVSLEPRPLPKMSMPLSTLKNPSATGMYANEALASADHIPFIASFKGWGINKSA